MTVNSPDGSTTPATLYRERIWPSPWVFVATALVIPASLLVFLPINLFAGVIVAIVLYAAIVLILVATSPVIVVSPGELVAGRARVPVGLIGTVTPYRGEEATLQRGRLLDSRAWLLIRGWVSPVVKIEIADETDPTPYWIVSTRTPDALVAALATARTP
ncbi:DUF3093 domain-containing protein [Lacisediminihabitans sp. FW035]